MARELYGVSDRRSARTTLFPMREKGYLCGMVSPSHGGPPGHCRTGCYCLLVRFTLFLKCKMVVVNLSVSVVNVIYRTFCCVFSVEADDESLPQNYVFLVSDALVCFDSS